MYFGISIACWVRERAIGSLQPAGSMRCLSGRMSFRVAEGDQFPRPSPVYCRPAFDGHAIRSLASGARKKSENSASIKLPLLLFPLSNGINTRYLTGSGLTFQTAFPAPKSF
jgi:hypothetical protein